MSRDVFQDGDYLMASDVQGIQDQSVIVVATQGEMDSLPQGCKTAYMNGYLYRRVGTAWVQEGADKVLKGGDTMSGNLILSGGAALELFHSGVGQAALKMVTGDVVGVVPDRNTSHTSPTYNQIAAADPSALDHLTTKRYVDNTAASVANAKVTNAMGSSTTVAPSQAAVTSAVNAKANTSHTHTIANVTSLQSAIDGKANSSHTHIPTAMDYGPVLISGAHMVWPDYQTVSAVEPNWTPYWPGVKFAMPAGLKGWVRATVAGYTDVLGGTSSAQGALFGLDLGVWGEGAGDGSSAWSNDNATAIGRLTAPAGQQLRTSYIASGWRYHWGNGDMFIVPLGQALGSLVSGGHVKFGLCRATLEFYPGHGGYIHASTF